MRQNDKQQLFEQLRQILQRCASGLECTHDSDNNYELYTRHLMKNKKPLYFAGVKINKSSVSYQLMGLYIYPELLTSLSVELRKRLKSKSCFNFTTYEGKLAEELKMLTQSCLKLYKQNNYI